VPGGRTLYAIGDALRMDGSRVAVKACKALLETVSRASLVSGTGAHPGGRCAEALAGRVDAGFATAETLAIWSLAWHPEKGKTGVCQIPRSADAVDNDGPVKVASYNQGKRSDGAKGFCLTGEK